MAATRGENSPKRVGSFQALDCGAIFKAGRDRTWWEGPCERSRAAPLALVRPDERPSLGAHIFGPSDDFREVRGQIVGIIRSLVGAGQT